MAERIIKLPETKGTFKVRGIVTGCSKTNFYEESTIPSGKAKGKPKRRLSFGIKSSETNTHWIQLDAFEQNNVYFYKKPTEEEKAAKKKGITETVAWDKRDKFSKTGFELIGMKLGLSYKINEKGTQVTDQHTFTDFDAALQLKEKLKDGMSVTIIGVLDFQDYINAKGEAKKRRTLVPQQIYLTKDIDFKEESFVEEAYFDQEMVVTALNLIDNDKGGKDLSLIANIINYGSIAETDFILKESDFAKAVYKNLKPYTKIKFNGKMNSLAEVEEEEVDEWGGESNPLDRKLTNYKKEFIITGRDPQSLDTTTYTKKEIDNAITALIEFSNKDTINSDSWNDTDSTTNDGWDNL